MSATASRRGLFISFEGIDGSGKSTQARLLAEALRAEGAEVVLTREPGGSPGAEEIRGLVLRRRSRPLVAPRPRSCCSPPPAATTWNAPSARRWRLGRW